MTRWTVSASSRSARLVEPQTSEKMAVTIFLLSAINRVYDPTEVVPMAFGERLLGVG